MAFDPAGEAVLAEPWSIAFRVSISSYTYLSCPLAPFVVFLFLHGLLFYPFWRASLSFLLFAVRTPSSITIVAVAALPIDPTPRRSDLERAPEKALLRAGGDLRRLLTSRLLR